MSRAPFDLAYTHEMAACAPLATATSGPSRAAVGDLTARLRCLKALHDAARGERMPRRVH